MIHDEICTYEVAKLAREKGFPLQKVIKQDGRALFYELPQSHPDWAYCDAWYLPTQSLLSRWLRDTHAIDIDIYPIFTDGEPHNREYGCQVYTVGKSNKPLRIGYAKTYENMLDKALKYALENFV